MAAFGTVHLPPGYRVAWVESDLRLFDSRAERVATYPAALASVLSIEEEAWRHAWAQIDSEMRRELKQFHRGTRTVAELHRLRQYVRFLEILAGAGPGAMGTAPPRRPIPLIIRRPLRAAKVAAVVGLVAAGLLLFLLVPREPPSSPTVDAPGRGREAVAPSHHFHTEPVGQKAAPAPTGTTGESARIGRQMRPIAGYAMTFGRFTTLKAAQACAQRIRSKGYMATVVRVGSSFRVLGRTYTTRAHAEQMARILQEIDLPASVQAVGL